ncbi:MAG: hypothetical protein J0H37_04300, partial [Hyphomicrobium denitrificans]|nr:hypothetical protein [Hyphomicrobium denitrificans]
QDLLQIVKLPAGLKATPLPIAIMAAAAAATSFIEVIVCAPFISRSNVCWPTWLPRPRWTDPHRVHRISESANDWLSLC